MELFAASKHHLTHGVKSKFGLFFKFYGLL